MICGILLLIDWIFCVCGTFVVNVTQTSYQAKENDNITMGWMYSTQSNISPNSLFIYCEMLTDHKATALFDLYGGVERPESQDEQFAGRVPCDKGVLREGRIRLDVSRLRTDDSGLYRCEVTTNHGSNFSECRLNVIVASDRPKDERQKPTSHGTTTCHCGLGLRWLPVPDWPQESEVGSCRGHSTAMCRAGIGGASSTYCQSEDPMISIRII